MYLTWRQQDNTGQPPGFPAERFATLPDPLQPAVVLLHIPKTGGTSLHQILVKNFATEEICPERFNRLKNWSLEALGKFRLFSGHFDRGGVARIPQEKRIVSLFREPKARILSLYHYWRSHKKEAINRANFVGPRIAKSKSLIDFLRDKSDIVVKNTDNILTRTLLGKLYVGPNGEYLCPKDEVIGRVIEYFGELYAFGVMDEFDNSVRRILNALEFPVPDQIPHAMDSADIVNPALEIVERATITTEVEAELERLTEMDQQVYHYALGRFRSIREQRTQRTAPELFSRAPIRRPAFPMAPELLQSVATRRTPSELSETSQLNGLTMFQIALDGLPRKDATVPKEMLALPAKTVDGRTVLHLSGGDGTAGPGGRTGGFSIRVPESIEKAASGKRVRVTVEVRTAGGIQAAEFSLAYSTNDVGNSGWRKFTAGREFEPKILEYDVPAMKKGNGDYVGILPAPGPGVEIASLKVEAINRM